MDPNKYKFSTIVRITAIIFKFIHQLKRKIKVVTYITKNDTRYQASDIKGRRYRFC